MLKAVIGEYGKIIVLTVIACILILFMFGGGAKGLEEILKSTGPKATVGHGDSHELADDIASRNIPVLAVTTKKLKKGMKYNQQIPKISFLPRVVYIKYVIPRKKITWEVLNEMRRNIDLLQTERSQK